MEQGKKNCPYCGEEIMASAKKCKHCGEWLNTTADNINQMNYQVTQRESCLKPECLYDRYLMNILFWITIIGIIVSKIYQDDTSIHFKLPEIIGIFLGVAGEICFLFLLMKAMSYMNKPLKVYFIIAILLNVTLIVLFLIIIIGAIINEEFYFFFMLMSYASYAVMILLGIQFVINYDGKIKLTGWIIIIYNIFSIIWFLIEDNFVPAVALWFGFILDILYYRYISSFLSRTDE